MKAPVPALSTSADVEPVRRALMASRLTWGVHADRWGDREWQREFWTEAATIAVAALSTPPTEGPGAVGAGSAVKALAEQWNATPDYTPSDYDRGRVDQRHDMTGQLRGADGGPLTEAEFEAICEGSWKGGKDGWRAAINDVLAARATRPAPDDQAEGER